MHLQSQDASNTGTALTPTELAPQAGDSACALFAKLLTVALQRAGLI